MMKRTIKDMWMMGCDPSILSIRIKYMWWKLSWSIIKSKEVPSEITMEQIKAEAAKLLND